MESPDDHHVSDREISEFHNSGTLLIRNFYSHDAIQDIRRGIYEVIGRVMRSNNIPDNRPSFSGDNFDAGYQQLIAANRSWGGDVYDAVKQIPAFLRLVSTPAHELLFRKLRPGSSPGVAGGGYGIRIDNPHEDKYRAMWHQEYPAQLRSPDGIVFWSPLLPITEQLGPVIVCPGSHKEGPLPVYQDDPTGAGRSGAYSLRIINEEFYTSKYPKISPLCNPSDLMLLDFLVLHSSGYNRASRSRWSMQFRYFNFANPIGTSHAWRGSYAAGVDFRRIHPELFTDKTPTR